MSKITFKNTPAHLVGDLPATGQTVAFSKLVKTDLSEASLDKYSGKTKILNIFPSIDTSVCATAFRHFNKDGASLQNAVVLNVSMDLPFALGRFCKDEGIENCEAFSAFRSDFGKNFGIVLKDTPLAGLFARAVVVLSPENKVIYSELVSEITHEPNYEAALKAANHK